MSLNFDSTKCTPPLPKDDNDSALREVLIFGTMGTGMNSITKENYHEFYARVHAQELLFGSWRTSLSGDVHYPIYVTKEEIKRWIGLTTNASIKTRNQFLKTLSFALDDFKK